MFLTDVFNFLNVTVMLQSYMTQFHSPLRVKNKIREILQKHKIPQKSTVWKYLNIMDTNVAF